MKKLLHLFSASLLCLGLFLNISTAQAARQGIRWHSADEPIFAIAKKEHRFILIYGKAEWCHWCQMVRNQTFTDPAVVQIVNAHYLPVMIDVDNDSALANQYQINEFPTFQILDSSRHTLKVFRGYTSADTMARYLKQIVKEYKS